MWLWATPNNQLTINPKDGKRTSLGSWPEPIIAFRDLCFLPVLPLRSCSEATLVKSMSPRRRWWTRVGIPEKAFFPFLGLIVSSLLAVAHIYNLYVYYPQPVGSLTLYGAASFHVCLTFCLTCCKIVVPKPGCVLRKALHDDFVPPLTLFLEAKGTCPLLVPTPMC